MLSPPTRRDPTACCANSIGIAVDDAPHDENITTDGRALHVGGAEPDIGPQLPHQALRHLGAELPSLGQPATLGEHDRRPPLPGPRLRGGPRVRHPAAAGGPTARPPARTARRRRRSTHRRRPSATPPSASFPGRARTAPRPRPAPVPAIVADANRAASTARATAPTGGEHRGVAPSHASPMARPSRLRIGARSTVTRSRPWGRAGCMKPNM